MKKGFLVIVFLSFVFFTNAQKGFRIELGLGPTLGDSSEYYSYTLQGGLYYLWNISNNFNLGVTSGVLAFLGEGNGDISGFESIPTIYIPIAATGNIKLSQKVSAGLDIGYGLDVAGNGLGFSFEIGSDLYIKPAFIYNLKKKLALVLSYVTVGEDGYSDSTFSFGVNFGL